MAEKELEGRVAIVTGAGRNIGRAIALALAQGGAAVVVNARKNRAEAEAVAREIEGQGGLRDGVACSRCRYVSPCPWRSRSCCW